GALSGSNPGAPCPRVWAPLEVEAPSLPGRPLPENLARRKLAPATTLLGVDTWYLNDGRDVHLPGGTGGKGSRLYRQVQRMHLFMGAFERLMGSGASAALHGAERLSPVRFLTDAHVVSENYTLPGEDPSPMKCAAHADAEARTGKWRSAEGTPADGMSYRKCFDTLPLWANGLGKSYRDDPGYRTLEARGNRYMGCKDEDPNGHPEAGCR